MHKCTNLELFSYRIMYILPTHVGLVDTTEEFTNAIAANQIAIYGYVLHI